MNTDFIYAPCKKKKILQSKIFFVILNFFDIASVGLELRILVSDGCGQKMDVSTQPG